jgi:hypothetical protein
LAPGLRQLFTLHSSLFTAATLSLLCVLCVSAVNGAGSGALLDAIAVVESGNRNVGGDKGRAAGIYQLHAGACADTGNDHSAAWWPATARRIAGDYIGQLASALRRNLKRDPSPAELYAAYNLGLRGFARRGFSLARCPSSTRRAAARVAALVRAQEAFNESAVRDRRYNELAAATYWLVMTRPE